VSARHHRTRLSAGGRVVIPAEFRDALGLAEGAAPDLFLEDGQVRIVSRIATVRKAKERIRLAVGHLANPSGDILASREAEE
jgi:AbrB family looped-hinge helix DNA binding protein